jgi:putative transposase
MIDATHLKVHRTAASLLKKGCSPTYRADERWPELKTPRGVRWQRQAYCAAALGRPDERLPRRGTVIARVAEGESTAGGSRL